MDERERVRIEREARDRAAGDRRRQDGVNRYLDVLLSLAVRNGPGPVESVQQRPATDVEER